MAKVERGDHLGTVTFREGDHGRIDSSEWQVQVLLGELGHASPLRLEHWLDNDLASCDRAQERQLRLGPDAVGQQIGDLGHDQLRNDQRPFRPR